MKKAGFIRYVRGKLTIIDRAGLDRRHATATRLWSGYRFFVSRRSQAAAAFRLVGACGALASHAMNGAVHIIFVFKHLEPLTTLTTLVIIVP